MSNYTINQETKYSFLLCQEYTFYTLKCDQYKAALKTQYLIYNVFQLYLQHTNTPYVLLKGLKFYHSKSNHILPDISLHDYSDKHGNYRYICSV